MRSSSAGIGGSNEGAGGTVVIRDGAVKVVGGLNASVIGHGSGDDDDGSISIFGGIFGMTVEIVGGMAYLGVSVRTNAEKGFMVLESGD